MIDLAILLLINSAVCFGFWNACLYVPKKEAVKIGGDYNYIEETPAVKGVLWRLEKWGQGKWYYKPIGGCISCMASLHSIYPYWTYMYMTNAININALLFYPVYILALSGVNYLIDRE